MENFKNAESAQLCISSWIFTPLCARSAAAPDRPGPGPPPLLGASPEHHQRPRRQAVRQDQAAQRPPEGRPRLDHPRLSDRLLELRAQPLHGRLGGA